MTLEEFRTARSEQKRRDILSAALDVFRDSGFANAAMDKIAGKASVSTATLYRHFPSKEALFEAVAADAIDHIVGPDLAPEAGADLEALALAYAELLTRPDVRAIVRMLIGETGIGGPVAERFYESVKSRLSDRFAAVVAHELSRPQDDPDLSRIAGQLQGMIEHSTLLRGLILGDSEPPIAEAEMIAGDALATWRARWQA